MKKLTDKEDPTDIFAFLNDPGVPSRPKPVDVAETAVAMQETASTASLLEHISNVNLEKYGDANCINVPKLTSVQAVLRSEDTRASEVNALASVPPESIIELIAGGMLLPDIAREMRISLWSLARYVQMSSAFQSMIQQAEELGAQTMISQAWSALKHADPDSKGGAGVAKGIADFATWYAGVINPRRYKQGVISGAERAVAPQVNLSIEINSDQESNAMVVSSKTIDGQAKRIEAVPFELEMPSGQE